MYWRYTKNYIPNLNITIFKIFTYIINVFLWYILFKSTIYKTMIIHNIFYTVGRFFLRWILKITGYRKKIFNLSLKYIKDKRAISFSIHKLKNLKNEFLLVLTKWFLNKKSHVLIFKSKNYIQGHDDH